ncbi:hypothetical protein [Nocardioides sp. YIM 152315]|uniref:hypothetical protein n=1 Tax=Nocardioides sp. YIM 152315 TaxID=3031760 RepID=UPI0023DC8677|nr:hypothetical protein [Nocardioides sp. YIM 152315]MDF1605492.1 hypothetical protein [Nocardioides sp. YIM 152315]
MNPLHLLLPVLLAAPTPQPETAAATVLHAWDERRAEAWAAGDVAALRSLYAPGSAAGRADARMLHEWLARGLRVEGMQMQLLRVDVRRGGDRRLVVLVADRLVGPVAVGPGVRVPLPRDEVSTRRLVLVRAARRWRVAQASPARTTSWTVRSRKE